MQLWPHPHLKHHTFAFHFTRNLIAGILMILAALFLGMAGYHYLEDLSWVDSYLNAAMILSGMGPATVMQNTSGKVFAASYALFSGLVFVALIALVFSPIIHAIFKQVHLEKKNS